MPVSPTFAANESRALAESPVRELERLRLSQVSLARQQGIAASNHLQVGKSFAGAR